MLRTGGGARVDRLEALGERLGLEPPGRRAAGVDELVAQDAEQIPDVVLVADPARLRQDQRECLLYEVLGVGTGAREGPRGSKESIYVIPQGAGIEDPAV